MFIEECLETRLDFVLTVEGVSSSASSGDAVGMFVPEVVGRAGGGICCLCSVLSISN